MLNKVILAAFTALLCLQAYAMDVEASVGASKLSKGPNGTWYQEGFPYTLSLKSESLSFGVKNKINETTYWRAGYLYFGRASSEAVATASDENYSGVAPTYCNGRCWDMSHWYGTSHINGIYAGVVKEVLKLPVMGEEVPLSVEGGIYAYIATWTMTIPDWKACELCGPQYLQVEHKKLPYATPYVGVGIGPVWISYYAKMQAQGDKWPAVYRGEAWRIELRATF